MWTDSLAQKKERKLPSVLNRDEALRILQAVDNVKHRAILLLTYSLDSGSGRLCV